MLWLEKLSTLTPIETAFWGGSAVVGIPLAVNFAKDIYFDRRKRKEEQRYIYVQLVFILDKLVERCAEIAWDQGYDPTFQEPPEASLKAQVAAPVFDISSVKGEHKYLPAKMLYRLHNIEIELQKAINAAREFSHDPNFSDAHKKHYFILRREQYIRVGLYVADISEEIRKKFNVKVDVDWDPKQHIVASLNDIRRYKSKMAFEKMIRRAQVIMNMAGIPF